MSDNHETVTVELSGQQRSVTVEQGGQGGSGEAGVSAAARDVSMSRTDIPIASEDGIGGVRIGEGLRMDGDVLNVDFPGDSTKYLQGDGEWSTPPDSEVEIVTVGSNVTLPLIAADHRNLWTGKKTKAVVMYTVAKRPVLEMATGQLSAASFRGDGADLENLNASQLKSGTIESERLPLATTTFRGAMSPQDKQLLDSLVARVEALEAKLNGD